MQIATPRIAMAIPLFSVPIVGSEMCRSSAIAHAASDAGSTTVNSAAYASCPSTRGGADSIGSEGEELMDDGSLFDWTAGCLDRTGSQPLPLDRSGEHARQQRGERAQRPERVGEAVLAQ